MTTMMTIPGGCRVPDAESGPLTDGGYRYVGTRWGVDLDRRGRATAIVLWPAGLSRADYLRGAMRAVRRAEAAWASECQESDDA